MNQRKQPYQHEPKVIALAATAEQPNLVPAISLLALSLLSALSLWQPV